MHLLFSGPINTFPRATETVSTKDAARKKEREKVTHEHVLPLNRVLRVLSAYACIDDVEEHIATIVGSWGRKTLAYTVKVTL